MANNSINEWYLAGTSSSGSVTYGGRPEPTYLPQELTRITDPVMKALLETKNKDIVKDVRELIAIIVELLLQLSASNFDIKNLPPLHGVNLDNGSFLIEWLSTNYRVGFLIEADPKESIWYLILKSASSDSNLSGSLTGQERRATLTQLVSYVASNS